MFLHSVLGLKTWKFQGMSPHACAVQELIRRHRSWCRLLNSLIKTWLESRKVKKHKNYNHCCDLGTLIIFYHWAHGKAEWEMFMEKITTFTPKLMLRTRPVKRISHFLTSWLLCEKESRKLSYIYKVDRSPSVPHYVSPTHNILRVQLFSAKH